MKRAFDLFLAMILLLVLMIPILLIALMILVTMGCPVLFRQIRPGYRGKPFTILKFRTMKDLKGENGKYLPDEVRLTRVGRVLRKFSLDELPQLVNVLKGELSFVGPRPLLMEYLPLYNERQARRQEVPQGITGWTQVNGRNAITWEEKFDLDIWYVEHRSLLLDMRIMWMTLIKILLREGITAEGSATMPEFKGSRKGGGKTSNG